MSQEKNHNSMSPISKLKQKKIYLFFLLIMVPVFISLDISQGLRFDTSIINNQKKITAIPLSMFFIFILFLFNIKVLIKNKLYILFLFSSLAMTLLSVLHGNMRIIIIFFQMNVFLISFYIFKDIFKNYDKHIILDIFFRALSLIIVIKLIFDILLFQTVNSPYFINDTIHIYNYYAYFPFVYFLAGILSLRNIWFKKMVFTSLLVFTLSLISLIYGHSRLFTYSFYLVPFLIIFYYTTKLNKKIIFHLYLLILILGTIYFASNPYFFEEESMQSRLLHWSWFFQSLKGFDYLFPFINEYRNHTTGSFHNELLEIFSFFGLVSLLFFFQLYRFTTSITVDGFSTVVKLLLFVIIIGMGIQINVLNPYLSVFLGLFLSLSNKTEKMDKKNNLG